MIEKKHGFEDIQHELTSKDVGRLSERRTLRERNALNRKLRHFVREHYRASLQADGIDVLKVNPLELEVAELASVIEWLKTEAEGVRVKYEELIGSMGDYEFSKDINADRLLGSSGASDETNKLPERS